MRVWLAGFFMLVLADVYAQENNQTCKLFAGSTLVTNDRIIVKKTIKIDGLLPSSVQISQIADNEYLIKVDTLVNDSLNVCYRVLPIAFSSTFSGDTTRYYDSTAFFTDPGTKPADANYAGKRQELFDMGDLNRSGQISRGISAGNSQNLSVNSSLNLNLDGKLSEDLSIRATITDQDIPYQPEGNTQQLQDFDKVYVQLYNDKFSVVGGDVVMQNDDNHFLKYRKNVVGGTADYSTKNSRSSVGASSAKGQFSSSTIEVEEGVYGPYKIPAPNNIGFVIIIANSEKIFLDGKQLIRGYDNDYTIDYNQAEIEFTSNVLITQYSRVRVDFEYAVRSYARSILSATHTQSIGNTNLGVTYYEEKDNKNKSLFRPLSDDDKTILSNVGDSLQLAVVSGATLVEFNEGKILYYKKDTIISGLTETVFAFADTSYAEIYDVQYTDVGYGNGNYQISEYLANGRVYEWVGNGNGSFVPYILLSAPNKKQMIAVSGDTKVGANTNVYFESMFSKVDENLFSNKHKENDNGQAFLVGTQFTKLPIGNTNYTFSSKLETEYLSKDFKAVDRFRKVEFDRDWGISGQSNNLGERDINLTASAGFEKNNRNYLEYETHYRTKENTIDGFQHMAKAAKTMGFLQVSANAFLMDGTMPTMTSRWRRFNGEAYILGKIQPGYRYVLEQNTANDISSDSIISSKNYFEEHQFFVRSNFSKSTQFEVQYSNRFDKAPQNGELKGATEAKTITSKLTSKIKSNHTLSMVLNYRELNNRLLTIPNVQTVSGRVDWIGDIIPKAIRNELNYSIANARVPKREYVFVEVPTGEGTHTWRDDNEDGVKDLEEFYEAFNYDEKRYIKLFVPSNEFVEAFENRFNYRLHFGFPISWRKGSNLKKLASRFSNTTAWTSQYSTTEDNLGARLVPFIADIDTSKLQSSRESFRSTLFVNKNDPRLGINVGYLTRSRKVLYANGYEGRKDVEYSTAVRWNVKRLYQFDIKALFADRTNRSDYLSGRNYNIQETRFSPSLAWQPKPTFRVTTRYNISESKQVGTENQSDNSLMNEILSEVRLGSAAKFVLNAQLKYTKVEFEGNEQSPLGYELLKGLKPGDNVSLILSWQQRLVNGLQVQLYYEGRKPNNASVIHSMRAGINALF